MPRPLCLLALAALILVGSFGCAKRSIWQSAEWGKYHEIERQLDDNSRLVNAQDSSGWTPLMHAVAGGHEKVVKQLLDRGADPRVKANSNWDALKEARRKDNKNIQTMIEDAIEEANRLDQNKK